MSDVNYSINASVRKGYFSQQFVAGGLTATMAETGMLAVTLEPGTSTQQIQTSAASALGLSFARNLATDTTGTSTISFGRLDGTSLYEAVRLKPGDAAWLRLAPGDYGARAAADSIPLLIQILED